MTRLALALAVAAAWLLFARVRTSRQRALAIWLSALFALDAVHLIPALAPAGHAVFVVWYGVTACLVVGGLGRQAWPLVLPWFIVLGIFHGTGPTAFWLALALQFLAVAAYLYRREIPGQVETAALLVAASSLADVAGPWLAGDPTRDWKFGAIPAILTWIVVAGWEARCWISARRRHD